MFNAETKNRYIEEVCQTEQKALTARQTFDATASLESDLNLDLIRFDEDALRKVFEILSGGPDRSKTTKETRIVRSYIRWAADKGLIGGDQTNWNKVSSTGVNFARNRLFASDYQLNIFMDYCFQPIADDTFDNFYRVLLWLAFAGVPIQKAFSIDESEVDIWNMRITHDGAVFQLSPYALPAIQRLMMAKQFKVLGGRHPRTLKREKGTLLLRRTNVRKTDQSSDDEKTWDRWVRNTMRPSLMARFRDAEKRFVTNKPKGFPETLAFGTSYKYIALSGVYYRMYQRELAGLKPNFREVAIEQADLKLKDSEEKGDIEKKRRLAVRAKRWSYSRNYDAWKAAFVV